MLFDGISDDILDGNLELMLHRPINRWKRAMVATAEQCIGQAISIVGAAIKACN